MEPNNTADFQFLLDVMVKSDDFQGLYISELKLEIFILFLGLVKFLIWDNFRFTYSCQKQYIYSM